MLVDIVCYYSYLLRYLHISASISVALLVLTNQATVIVCVIKNEYNMERMPQKSIILNEHACTAILVLYVMVRLLSCLYSYVTVWL